MGGRSMKNNHYILTIEIKTNMNPKKTREEIEKLLERQEQEYHPGCEYFKSKIRKFEVKI